MEKEPIVVWDYGHFHHRKEEPVKLEVNAWCLQGTEGFLAYFFLPGSDLLYEAHGDDGSWTLVGCMHKHWIKELKEVVNSIEEG